MTTKSIAIIGGGPAAMSLACHLDTTKYTVTIYEKNKALGRKFLVAGKGGFNLTYHEDLDYLLQRYEPPAFLAPALRYFDNKAFRKWLAELGIPTYVGSSSRVFPERGIKPIEVLNAVKQHMVSKGTTILYDSKWVGWSDQNQLLFESGNKVITDYVVFALGGGSWKITGSDGSWLSAFRDKSVAVIPFSARNCAFGVEWPKDLKTKYAGQPLKNISISAGGRSQKGELVITEFGLEGNAIYAVSSEIQNQIKENNTANIFLDLKPSLSLAQLQQKYERGNASKTSDILRESIKLDNTQLALLKAQLTKDEFLNKKHLLYSIKNLSLKVYSPAPLDEAISSMGGIDLAAINEDFKIKNLVETYCIGEMLNWNAPTGGYLLQGCFSMGAYLAKYFNECSISS